MKTENTQSKRKEDAKSSSTQLTNNKSILSGKGVSIIVLTHNGADLLDRLLSSFHKTNTHRPIEWIIVDHDDSSPLTNNKSLLIGDVLVKHFPHAFIRHIKRDKNYSFSDSCNYGAAKARHPYLLLINNDIIYTSDVLPSALAKLEKDESVGAVGVRLDDVHSPTDSELSVNGDRLIGKNEPDNTPPINNSQLTINQKSPAVTAAFLLCRKSDFQALNGFSENCQPGLEVKRTMGTGYLLLHLLNLRLCSLHARNHSTPEVPYAPHRPFHPRFEEYGLSCHFPNRSAGTADP